MRNQIKTARKLLASTIVTPVAALMVFTTAPSGALAQTTQALSNANYLGANISRQYDMNDLNSRPALLTLGKGDLLILDFPADVSSVTTPQALMLDVPEPLGNVATLTGKVSSGTANVMVQLDNGQYATFIVTLTPGGNGIKRVKIINNAPLDFAQPVTTTGSQSMPTYKAPNGVPLVVIPSATTKAATTTKTTPIQMPAPLAVVSAPQPTWLNFNAAIEGAQLTITIKNDGTRPVTLTGNELKLLEGGTDLLSHNITDNFTIPAGTSKSITGTLQHVPTSLKLLWPAHDNSASMIYMLTN